MSRPRAELPGLQAERTLLAWERTALGLLANGALLMLRGALDAGGFPVLVPAAGALTLALLAAVIGLRRGHRIAHSLRNNHGHLRTVPAPSAEVLILGAGVTALSVLAVAVIVI